MLTHCATDRKAAEPLLILLRRFAAESAREEARMLVGSTCPAKERFGRDAPESGRVMLTLSFVVRDP